MLTFEFLAPFYVFAATTMAIASAFTWLHGRNPILATILLGQTLFYVIGAIAAFQGRAKLRNLTRV